MKPWMWAVIGSVVVVLILLIGVVAFRAMSFSQGAAPPAAPAPAVETDAPSRVTPPTPMPPPSPLPAPTPSTDDTDAEDPDTGPDLTPEHVERAAFDEVFDEVIETCGLGGWSEMKRECTDWRCLSLVAAEAEPSANPTVDSIVNCPAWVETWGKHPDFWIFGAECEDGTVINISLLGPSTLRMRRGIDQGFIEEFQVDLDRARDEACASWGT